MKIDKLTLHNFGIYANTSVIDFRSNKPVILVGGLNGRGKTTLLEAILLALYGRRSFAFSESNLSFPNYLSKFVNQADGSLETYIELFFELSSGNEISIYSVKREWSLNTAVPSFKTVIEKNGYYDQVLSDNWDLFIEEILPNAIAPFFFFDGEKISEIANSENDDQMKNSIKSLLGVDIIDQAIMDIRKIMNNKKRAVKSDVFAKEIAELDKRISFADSEAKEAREAAGSLEINRNHMTRDLKEAQNSYASMGGNLATDRKELLAKHAAIQERLEETNAHILDIISDDLPLLMVIPLLKQVLDVACDEKDKKAMRSALSQLPVMYKKFEKSQNSIHNFDEFIKYVNENTAEVTSIYDLTENGYFQLKTLYKNLPTQIRQDVIRTQKQKSDLLSELTKVENYLSIDVNEDTATKKYNEILNLTADLARVSEQLRQAHEVAMTKHTIAEDLRRQQLKVIEKAVESLEGEDDVKRIVTYSGYSLNVLEEYKVRLQKAKTNQLAKTITSCFKQIVAKQNLIDEIKINPETLDFIYLDSDGINVNRAVLSAGEKQLLVIAILWALGICSKRKFPVIIDTPLARLDSIHRESLITNYFPKASEQTILLSTDSEIFGKYYEMLRPHIEKEYSLVYSDETKKTIIQHGYFGGEVS